MHAPHVLHDVSLYLHAVQDPKGAGKQRREQMMVPSGDAAALAAYVRLLAAVASHGSPAQQAQRLAAWEASAQVLTAFMWGVI